MSDFLFTYPTRWGGQRGLGSVPPVPTPVVRGRRQILSETHEPMVAATRQVLAALKPAGR